MKRIIFIKIYPTSKRRMLLSEHLPQTSRFFTRIYRNFTTLYSFQLSLLSNFSQDIVLWWEQALQKSSESESSVMVLGKCEWTTYIFAIWRWKKQYRCFEIIAQKVSAKNMNNNLVFFRDEIEIFIISLFETRSRFVSSISRASRRDREFALSNLEFREGDEK